MKDALELLNKEELSSDMSMLADIIGMDNIRELIRQMSGLNLYIPKVSSLRTFVKKYIKLNSLKTFKELAKDLTVSEQHVRNIKNEILSENRNHCV